MTARSDDKPWGQALAGRRFRWVLLGLAGVPIGLAYLWYGFVKPLLSDEATDFVREYLAGGRVILNGGDPYQCGMTTALCDGYPHYLLFYPPFAYWVAQPLVRFDSRLVAGIALVVANVLLFAAIWLVLRALRVRDSQFAVLAILVTISFPPTLTVIQNRNSQVVVLMLIAIMLTGWLRGDRWWGGAALGVGLAVKLIQAPLLLLSLWGRRLSLAAAAVVTWAVLWLVAVPQYLPEFLFRVAPSQVQGSHEVLNVAPFGTFNRLLHPETLYNSGGGGGALVLGLSGAFGLMVLLITARRLGAPRSDREGRVLEVATGVAASPLLFTLTYAGQLVLLLLPMLALLHFGIRTRSRTLVVAVAVSWALMGPSYLALTNAMATGFGSPLVFQIWADSAVAGVIVLWVASVHSLRAKNGETQQK
ncbi:MAG: DUF2029 domain-containing protein [Chloroflexi bacterium]|nr:MAG: DUF2029 domain-containing protein [Chloroflexota bacterium]